MATSKCASRVELLQGRFYGKMDKWKESGIESDSLPYRRYKYGIIILKMERGEKYETENRRGLLAEFPARRQRHTREKLVLLDKDLSNLNELRRLNGEGTIN